MFAETARELGYHPFPRPSSNCSRPYTNIEGLTLGACQLCGYCDRNGCEANAKAGPHACALPRLREEVKIGMRNCAWGTPLVYDKMPVTMTGLGYTVKPHAKW